MNKVLKIYNNCKRLPLGGWVFSRLLCFNAPYFSSIRPLIAELKPHYCKVKMKKRRAVQNHLKSVHAIAMCNMCELVAGTALEVSIPPHLRWIPKTMSVDYLKMAKTDLTGACEIPTIDWDATTDLPLIVNVNDTNGTTVLRATILMYLSPKG
ncbi:DUF4442 domain-containing protein [bacterium]|nr:DUF4442 domain-containing protein [bacterium]